ncbi:MAG: AMP-binding protein [Candidatus Dormibacteraeota bacterium]|nr:AMP-binding protein [Candidatus Dormibacteraeota bacterium]MBO0705778.1 AMP-binding protein [Candidatus Dormibacteraeota bacterium]MBO0762710.1 AMP-binding protein [Candidatus Dormibacteraeota bacterium]
MDSAHAERPWLAQYPSHVPADLEPPFTNAAEMFRATARRAPDRAAVHYFERTITFGELDRASDALARALADRGVGRGDRVAVYLQNVPQFPLAMLGIWKAGAAMVPLNPMLKDQEAHFQLSDSGARLLIALEGLYEAFGRAAVSGTPVEHVLTTSEVDELEGEPGVTLAGISKLRPEGTEDLLSVVASNSGRSVPDPGLGGDDVALMTYTSGTTGRPKGALNTHRNVVFNAEVYRTWMRLGDGDVVLGAAPLFHITGLIGHAALSFLAGLPLVLFHRFEPGDALRMAERWRCTFTVAAITAFMAMMEHADMGRRDLSALRTVYSGGAPVAPPTVARFEELTGAYIHNIYGLTETTSPSHGVPLGARAPVDEDSGALSVGVPIPGTEVRIVDTETGLDVPAGSVGELWTRGPEVVPGYWQRPDATAESFTDGYLHTGDVGKMDEHGWFYLVDRAKDMINAAGYKVWPREVEDYLYQHPAVREAAVVGVADAYRGETVKAFVSLKAGSSATSDEIIAFCRDRMAAYKYPRQVEIIDEVPKTATGKFLRRELRGRERERERTG